MAGNLTMSNVFPGDSKAQEGTSFTLLAIYNFLQIFGFAAVVIILLTAWRSPQVRRSSVWFSFMASWLLFCLSYFLIAGQQTGAEPAFGVCVMQASLVYGVPVLTSCGTVSVLLHLYFTIRSVLRNGGQLSSTRTRVIQFFPLFFFVIVFFEALIIGLSNPKQVTRDTTGMFCHFNSSLQAKITAAAVFLAATVMIVFEIKTAVLLYKNWVGFQRLRIRSNDTVSLALVIRVSIFSFLPMIAGALSAVSFLPKTTVAEGVTHLFTAILPTAAAILFGTQQDILHAWMFWKKAPVLPDEKAQNSRATPDAHV